jgi:hypothetical protein
MLAPNWILGRLIFGKRGLLPEKENELVGIAVYFYHFKIRRLGVMRITCSTEVNALL